MLTHMKFENRPVHLFNIAGRKYYVTRSSFPQTGSRCAYICQWGRRCAGPGKYELPAGRHEGCTDLLDPLNARQTPEAQSPEREKNAREKSPLNRERTTRKNEFSEALKREYFSSEQVRNR